MITEIIVLMVIGVALGLITRKLPMDDTIKIVIQTVIMIACVIYLLALVGIGEVPARFRLVH